MGGSHGTSPQKLSTACQHDKEHHAAAPNISCSKDFFHDFFIEGFGWYCWWTESCTTKDDDYPIICRVLTIPGVAGFCPSTVCFLGGQKNGSVFHYQLQQLWFPGKLLLLEKNPPFCWDLCRISLGGTFRFANNGLFREKISKLMYFRMQFFSSATFQAAKDCHIIFIISRWVRPVTGDTPAFGSINATPKFWSHVGLGWNGFLEKAV